MRKALSISFVLLAASGLALAQTSSLQTPISQTDLDAMRSEVTAVIPQPAAVTPPMETPSGSPGSANTFRRGDAIQPRITRSKTVTLASDCTASFDWSAQGALATPVQVALTPVYTGSGVPKCWATSATATSVSVKCVMENVALLSIVGINVGSITNNAPSGLTVGVIALPPS